VADENKKIILSIILIIFAVSVFFYASEAFQKESFEQKREKILFDISTAIEEAKTNGKYRCCIEPPCTMCYMGDWIWDDGTCDCDDMITKGEFDKVCPQCIKGIEEGKCESTNNKKCNI